MDLTKLLLPSSHLPMDVNFVVMDGEVSAHKSLLATYHPAFEQLFFGDATGAEVSRVKVGINLS